MMLQLVVLLVVDSQNGISYLDFDNTTTKHAVLNNVFEVESLSIEFYVLPLTSPGGTDTGRILSRDRSDYWMVGRATIRLLCSKCF